MILDGKAATEHEMLDQALKMIAFLVERAGGEVTLTPREEETFNDAAYSLERVVVEYPQRALIMRARKVDASRCYLCGHPLFRHDPGCSNTDGLGGCPCPQFKAYP